jgi:glycosyltransferase involved in cell wall biosynthesis
LRILVLTRSYPAPGDLYKYPFVHRRVVAYLEAGHDVRVFQPGLEPGLLRHEFEQVSCWTGDPAAFERFAGDWQPDAIAAHGFSETMWDHLERVVGRVPVRAWLHGSEIPAFMRQKALALSGEARSRALEQVEQRCDFWREFLASFPPAFKLVFVSNSAVELAREDWGDALDDSHYAVVPNPIDTRLFDCRPKSAEDRFRVLLIRPFDSYTYANDLAVGAILKLRERDPAGRLEFTIIGDGPLFDQTLEPLRGAANVWISQRFLQQQEIAAEHSRHGVFLVPTRLDTQGVSRDEAMASGLVPVTNAVPAVREFVDDSCAALAAPEDAAGLADALWEMVEDPGLFLARSTAAAARIERERSNARLIPKELALLSTSDR